MRHGILRCTLVFPLCLLGAMHLQQEVRQWTSHDGKFKLEAELVDSDGEKATLRRADGTTIDVPLKRLSDLDRKFVESHAGDVRQIVPKADETPKSLTEFQMALEGTRKAEAKRLEKRIQELQEFVRLGSKNKKDPATREATTLLCDLGNRLKLVKSDKPYMPRLSPKDFSVGQIGELDDDLLLHILKIEEGTARIGVLFEEWKFFTGNPGFWTRGKVSRPDLVYLRAPFTANLALSKHGEDDQTEPSIRLIRSHVYKVVEKRPRGAASDYVLEPFKIDEVQTWLKANGNRTKK